MSQLDWLGNQIGSLLGVDPKTPITQLIAQATAAGVPEKQAVPVPQGATAVPIPQGSIAVPAQQTPQPVVVPAKSMEVPTQQDDAGFWERQGEGLANIKGNFDEATGWWSDATSDTLGSIGNSIDEASAAVESGLTGDPSKYNPNDPLQNPGTQEDQKYAAGMLKKQEAIKGIVDKDPESQAVIKAAGKVDIGELTRQLQLKGIGEEQFKDLAERTADGMSDGYSLKEMMGGAADFLGELWGDKAIQNALVYYTGARLMGYSGSGSGMAAGQVLLQGWANQDKQDLLTQTATSKANAKKAENDALDMSKTVSMWNPRTRQQEIGYMSKSGNFQRSSGGEIYNAREQGLQTYDKSNPMHRTGEELDSSNVENMDKAVKDVLANISGNKDIYTDEQRQTAQALFADGADLNAAYAIATRSARVAGADTGSTAYQNAVTGSIRKYMMRTIKNPTDAFSGNNVAGMVDAIRSDQLKAELTVEGSIPEFVFGKGTWTANGVSQMEEDYQLPYEAVATLNKRVDSINANLVANALENKHSPVKIKSLITPTKTLQRLAGIFKETVMKDPDALKHWSKVAAGSNTNAMGAWLASNKSTADHKYLGINNPDIAAKFQLLVDKQLQKK